MPIALPRRAWLLVCALGVLIAVVFALIPVGTRFGDDPLLRLRQLDPELSPPDTTAVCGSPIRGITGKSSGATLYELARSRACRQAARRRVLAAVAAGGVIVMFGLLVLVESRPPEPDRVGYPRREASVGGGR